MINPSNRHNTVIASGNRACIGQQSLHLANKTVSQNRTNGMLWLHARFIESHVDSILNRALQVQQNLHRYILWCPWVCRCELTNPAGTSIPDGSDELELLPDPTRRWQVRKSVCETNILWQFERASLLVSPLMSSDEAIQVVCDACSGWSYSCLLVIMDFSRCFYPLDGNVSLFNSWGAVETWQKSKSFTDARPTNSTSQTAMAGAYCMWLQPRARSTFLGLRSTMD